MFKIFTVFLALVLFILFSVLPAPIDSYAVDGVPVGVVGTSTPVQTWPEDQCIAMYKDGTWIVIDCPPTITPETFPTAEATEVPTATATPAPEVCVITADYNIFVRVVPGGSLVSTVYKEYTFPEGSVTRPIAKTVWSGLTYYKIGWIGVDPKVYAWVADYFTETGPCDSLPTIDNPFSTTSWGVWVGPGAPVSEVVQFGALLQSMGVHPSATLYGVPGASDALHAAGFTVYLRPWLPDGPTQSLPALDSARARVDQSIYTIGSEYYDCMVLTNEVVFRSVEYAAEWIREAISYSADRGVPCLVPVVWPPGHPPEDDLPALIAAYENAPIPVKWGVNLYPTTAGLDLSAVGGINDYTVWRWQSYIDLLPVGVDIIVTEAARGDGSETPDFDDIGRFVALIDGKIPYITFWYTAICDTGLGHWPEANLCGRLDGLANAITEGL